MNFKPAALFIRVITACALITPQPFVRNAGARDALAPSSAFKPICSIVQSPDGSFKIISGHEDFKKELIFVYVSQIIAEAMVIARDKKIRAPQDVISGLLKDFFAKIGAYQDVLDSGYLINGVSTVWSGEHVFGIKLPYQRAAVDCDIIYNFVSGNTWLQARDGTKIYVSVEPVDMEKEYIDIFGHKRVGLDVDGFIRDVKDIDHTLARDEQMKEIHRVINQSLDGGCIAEECLEEFCDKMFGELAAYKGPGLSGAGINIATVLAFYIGYCEHKNSRRVSQPLVAHQVMT